jgi:AraC-like DNA-binding protein
MKPATKLWHDPDLAVDLLAVDRQTHTFCMHAHPELLLALFEHGAEVFAAAGRSWTARAGDLLIMPPGVAHDGAAETPDGYSYRGFYTEPAPLSRMMHEEIDVRLPGAPLLVSRPDLVRAGLRIHRMLERRHGTLMERQELLRRLMSGAFEAVGLGDDRRQSKHPLAAGRARDYLRDHVADDVCAGDLAAASGVSESRLAHVFSAAYGCSPAVYQTALRLSAVRGLIRAGMPLAEIAAALGFADQAHLTRRFKAAFGTTPGALSTDTRRPNTACR